MPGDVMYRALRRAVSTYARLDGWLRHAQDGARRAAEEFLSEALTVAEKADLGVHLYATAGGRPSGQRLGLWPWEEAWFRRRLPPPPATLLVGGAGAGRELRSLLTMGYRVNAFEPVAAQAQDCAALLGDRGQALAGTYQDLAATVLERAPTGLAPLGSRLYEAVILGWGSFTHVLDAAERRRTVQACARLAPAGPLLASFWMAGDERPVPEAPAARTPAARAGQHLRRLRKTLEPATPHAFGAWCGFAHLFSRAEVEQLAAAAERRVVWETEDGAAFPHVTLMPLQG